MLLCRNFAFFLMSVAVIAIARFELRDHTLNQFACQREE